MLAVSAALSACNRGDDWQASAGPARVCVDGQGHRLADEDCRSGGGGHGGGSAAIKAWYYLSRPTVAERGVPGVGDLVTGGSSTPLAGVSYQAAPARGIARGGFGGTAEGAGGHGGGE